MRWQKVPLLLALACGGPPAEMDASVTDAALAPDASATGMRQGRVSCRVDELEGEATLALSPGGFGSLSLEGDLAMVGVGGLLWGEVSGSARWTYDFPGGALSEVYALDISHLGPREGRFVIEGMLTYRPDPSRFEYATLACQGELAGDERAPSLIDASASIERVDLLFDELVDVRDARAMVGDTEHPLEVEGGNELDQVVTVRVRPGGLWSDSSLRLEGVLDGAGNAASVSVPLPAPLDEAANDNLGFEADGLAPWDGGLQLSELSSPAEVAPAEGARFAAIDAESLEGSLLRGRLLVPDGVSTLVFSIGMLDLRDVDRYFDSHPIAVTAHWLGGERTLWSGTDHDGALVSDVWSGWLEVRVPLAELPDAVELRFRSRAPEPPVHAPLMVVDGLRFE